VYAYATCRWMPFNASGWIPMDVCVLVFVGVAVFLAALGVLLLVVGVPPLGVQAETTRVIRISRHIAERLFFIELYQKTMNGTGVNTSRNMTKTKPASTLRHGFSLVIWSFGSALARPIK
jgi:hypothetical protein